MLLHRTLAHLFILPLAFALSGCDRQLGSSSIDDLSQQYQSHQKKLEQLEKQQQTLAQNEQALARAISHLDAREQASNYTELDPTQTRFFVLNNGSIGLAGRIQSITPTTDGSIIHISLVNLLSVPVANIGFHMTWGSEKPKEKEALIRWQQLLFSTKMGSEIELSPGKWKDIDLTLKGVSPNNLKYLKMSLNMDNLIFGTNEPFKPVVKNKKK